MQLAKRTFLFLSVNILIMATISIVIHVLGLNQYLDANGINYIGLLGFCLVWGMGGAFISLSLSKFMAKRMMNLKVIDPNTTHREEKQYIDMVYQLCDKAGMRTMPEVAIYESNDVNAFATGPSKNNSLVAVSTGLMRRMDRKEIEGVIGHEIAHIVNGDMVTMTLVQGVVNAFAMFLSRIIAHIITSSRDGNGNRHSNYMARFMVTMVLDILFTFLGSMLTAWFSRHREYRADKDGAVIAGKRNMINALKALQKQVSISPEEINDSAPLNTFKIAKRGSTFATLFSTHPPLESRIQALEDNPNIL